MKVYTLVACLL